jgi:dihydrofolate synthase/folylpolyglutamate synthase
VAHNPQSARALADLLLNTPCKGRTLAVFGVMGDKDLRGIVEPLVAQVDAWYLATPAVLRAAGVGDLERVLQDSGADAVQGYENVAAALRAATGAAREIDRVIVFGSFYTVAEAMPKPL